MANTTMTEGILRFVLRSSEAVARIRKALPEIQARAPWLSVVSCNIQPIPAAILEGEEEILLTETSHMKELFGTIPLYFAPQSFMQVTPTIAAKLYRAVGEYVSRNRFTSALDLFCGVGGFSLHVAPHVDTITGVELSPAAIHSAQKSAYEASVTNATFIAADVEQFLSAHPSLDPDQIVINPPRRGLSESICAHLVRLAPRTILYSSCNPETFARDVQWLSGAFQLRHVQPFDMFPMTNHCEVLGELRRIN
jgi:23S rRNA (uracil747-C5)-methyltransferase